MEIFCCHYDAVEPILNDDASHPMRHNAAADVKNSINESEPSCQEPKDIIHDLEGIYNETL